MLKQNKKDNLKQNKEKFENELKAKEEELKKLISVTEKLKKELERIKAVPSGIIRKLPVKRKQPLPVNPTLSNKARKKKRLQTGVAYGRS
mgnify:CR=1 FL=1